MSFNKDRAIVAQNSATAAATIVAALVKAGNPDAVDAFEDIRTSIFEGSLELAGGEPTAAQSNSGGRRSFGGGRSNGGGRADDAGAGVVIKFGKHAGQTIGEVYAQGEDGASYIEWLAESSTNPFIKAKAEEFVASVA